MEVGDNNQKHSDRSLASTIPSNHLVESNSEQDLLCNQLASAIINGDEVSRILYFSTEDKENSLPNCSEHQLNFLAGVQRSPDATLKVNAEATSSSCFQDALPKTSTPRVKSLNKNTLSPGIYLNTIPECDSNSIVDANVGTSEANQKAESPLKTIHVCRKSIFNWDEVDVGNYEFDHSENFFTRNRLSHERRSKIKLANELMASGHIYEEQNSYTELDNIARIEHQNISETSTLPLIQRSLDNGHDLNSTFSDDNATVDRKTQSLDETVQPKKIRPNIACQWSTQKVVCKTAVQKNNVLPNAAAAAMSMPPPPRAYSIKDVYEKKRQEAFRRLLEEERQKRIFHSRPIPNFSACHKKLEQKAVVHAITMPVTPKVLKHSRESDEKRRKKLEEWKCQNPQFKFESRSANVLKEEPFIPKKSQTTTQLRPFNLRSEHRLQDRKKYDVATKIALEEKVKQEEERRKTAEEELVKELRKRATFKARPNPFK